MSAKPASAPGRAREGGFWRRLAASLDGLSFFAAKSERDFFLLAITGGVFILPFAFYNFLQGRALVGAAVAALAAWFLLNGTAVFLGRRLVPAALVFLPALAVLAYALEVRPDLGVFWAYPAVLLFHFILPRPVANLYNAVVVVLASAFAFAALPAEIGTRVAVTLILTIAFANVFSYLTERQRRKEAQEEQQTQVERDRLALLVHATRAGFSDWDAAQDPQANAVIYSERFKEMLGYRADADTSKWPFFFEMMHPEDRARVEAEFRAMLRQKRSPGLQPPGQALDYRLRRADGSYVWVHAESVAQVDESLRIRRFITSYQDISKFREQEETIRVEQRRFELVVRAGNVGILDWDGVTRTAYYSPRFKEILGYPRDADTSGWPDYFDRIHPQDRPWVEERFRDHILGGRDQLHATVQYRLRRADDSFVWIEAVGASVRDEKGFATRFIASITDITERRAQEERLLTEQRRLDLVVRAQQVGIVDWDGHTHATYYSPRFKEILGYPPDADTSAWPDYFKALIHPDDRARVIRRWRGFIFGTGPEGPRGEYYSPEEYRLLRADGSFVWVQVSGVAVRDDKGFVTRWIAATTDITERRAQDEALRQSVRLREEVERMSRHDLKTPLNSVIAMSRLLRESGRLPAEDAELLGSIERAGYRILNMVNLSLDLFRMESGTYQFRPQPVDLAKVASKVAVDLESQAASKGIGIELGASETVIARGDELLCYSMLANLVKNAIEAAPEGSTVSVALGKSGSHVSVEVHNAGAVPEAMRGRFFQKYATAGKSAGMGLGTYSARLMARVQEGELELESSPAAGTTLIARLKLFEERVADAEPREPGRSPRALAREALPALHVLVVDDDEFNRLVLRRTLPTPPLSLTTAVNGKAALEAAEHDWPDVVLLDLEMPVMNGYDAARGLRELEKRDGRKRVTIVAISSNDEPAIVERALAAGCDHYLVKPAPREALWKILSGKVDLPMESLVLDPDLRGAMPDFLASRRQMLGELRALLAAGERARVKRLAHQLAGSFALYGFDAASARCQEIEAAALKGEAGELAARAAAVLAHLDAVEIRYAANMANP